MDQPLVLTEVAVGDVTLGRGSAFRGGDLVVDPGELTEVAAVGPPLSGLRVDVVRPGERTRVSRVLDVLEPRAKVDGPGAVFPGVATDELGCGSGTTLALAGLALVSTATLPNLGGAFEQEDALIDMAPPPGGVTPFSGLLGLVVSYDVAQGADRDLAVRAITESNARVARWLASLAWSGQEAAPEPAAATPAGRRPRIAYLCQVHSGIGGACDSYLRGASTVELEPTWVSPDELADGVVMSGDYHYACSRVPTYLYQRNPVLAALRRPDIDIAGVLLAVPQHSDERKRAVARELARLAAERDVDGVVVHPAAGGNTHLDALFTVQEVEAVGIRASMIVQEMAGPEGADPGLVAFVPEADCLISTGNREEPVWLEEAARVVGGELLLDGGPAAAAGAVPLRLLCSATTQAGALTRGGVAA